MKRIVGILSTVAIAAALSVSPALAKKDGEEHGNGHGRGHGKPSENPRHDEGDSYHSDRGSHDHDILRGWVVGEYKKHCPPGLAKKDPPCIPPGQAKKFAAGAVLPEDGWTFVPDDIVGLLIPPPQGARYVRMDKNVYLVTEGTRKVIEAIELFSQID